MITVLDFGGQYTHLIARRVRQLGAYSEIHDAATPASNLSKSHGVILSGGPQSVFDRQSPQGDPAILQLGVPVLGICYGLQWIVYTLGGKVQKQMRREYGLVQVHRLISDAALLRHCPSSFNTWMSHGDAAVSLPKGFSTQARSDTCCNAIISDDIRRLYGLQFHPEVVHTEHGLEILGNFVRLCDPPHWSVGDFQTHLEDQIRSEVKGRKVFLLVSGGVDSTVTFALLNKVLGTDHVQGLLIDNGLMRKNEVSQVRQAFSALGISNLIVEDASQTFLRELASVTDPEQKRCRIGDSFLAVQQEVSQRLGIADDEWMLGQGTIYPDTIETGGTKHADLIKTHHNRVDAVQQLIEQGRVIEPLKELYKDEVRQLGEVIGLPSDAIWRHPFPGPGLGVRILCASQSESMLPPVSINNVNHSLLPVRSVGVQGDKRTYGYALALYPTNDCEVTDDHWRLARQIPNEVEATNRVVVCLSHQQPIHSCFTPTFVDVAATELAREADAAVGDVLRQKDLYSTVWQFPVVLLPFGAEQGNRSIVLRPVESQEAMTVNATCLDQAVLVEMRDRLLQLSGIDMVFYDLTSKPPGTIEWE